MPSNKVDTRIVQVDITASELNDLLTNRAKAAGLIDFDPTQISIIENATNQGLSYTVMFERKELVGV